jgi:hypothetical protein
MSTMPLPCFCPTHRADALLDLVFGVVFHALRLAGNLALALGLRQILVTPGVRTNGVPDGGHLLEDAGLVGGVQADREEDRLGAMRGERGEHGWGVFGPWAVVESEHHLAFPQEVVALEVLESEAGAAGRKDRPPLPIQKTFASEKPPACACVAPNRRP